MILDLSKMLQFHEAMKYLQRSRDKIIEIKEYKPKRTNLQNRYYWAIINFISSETGNDRISLHEYFKSQFLMKIGDYVFNQKIDYNISTTELNTKEFTEYIEKISVFISDFGLSIPRPEDKDFEQFLNHYEKMI